MKNLRHPRYLLFLLVLVTAGAVFCTVLPTVVALVAGFDVAVLAFVASCVPLWRNGSPETIRRQAERDDAGQLLLLLLSGVISSVVLMAVAALLLARREFGPVGMILLGSTLMASWTFANLIFAFHYARLYYSRESGGDHEGLDFPGDSQPDFADFVNFAFVIGMTCQTADIDITRNRMRRVATFHGLFAFVFNLGVLALTVNVLASTS